MRLIGIDPGLQRTGWGVLEANGSRLGHVAMVQLSQTAACPWLNAFVSYIWDWMRFWGDGNPPRQRWRKPSSTKTPPQR